MDNNSNKNNNIVQCSYNQQYSIHRNLAWNPKSSTYKNQLNNTQKPQSVMTEKNSIGYPQNKKYPKEKRQR